MPTDDSDVLRMVESYQKLAQHPQKRSILCKDSSILSFLVYVLDDKNEKVTKRSIETLTLLTEKVEDRVAVANTYGVDVALAKILESAKLDETKVKTKLLLERLNKDEKVPLQQLQNSYEQLSVSGPSRTTKQGSNIQKPTNPLKRKQIKFVAGPGFRARSLTFKLPRTLEHEEKGFLEDNLLKIKGIISIYFDSQKSRCVLRVRMDVVPETVARTIIGTGLVDSVDHVFKNEDGVERSQTFTTNDDEKENIDPEDGPSYLNESFGESPKGPGTEKIIVSHSQHSKRRQQQGGWLSGVSSFLSNSFYW